MVQPDWYHTYVIGVHFSFSAIKYIGVTRASPIYNSAPIFAMILAVTFTGERINVPIVVGTLCIVVGLSLLMTSE